jgi:hypothetical protein
MQFQHIVSETSKCCSLLKNGPICKPQIALESYWSVLQHYKRILHVWFKIVKQFGSFLHTTYHLLLPPFVEIIACILLGILEMSIWSCSRDTCSHIPCIVCLMSSLFFGLLWCTIFQRYATKLQTNDITNDFAWWLDLSFACCYAYGLDHFCASYNILKFLKLCVETAYGKKFVRLLDPSVYQSQKNTAPHSLGSRRLLHSNIEVFFLGVFLTLNFFAPKLMKIRCSSLFFGSFAHHF